MAKSHLEISDEAVNKAVTETLAAQILAALTPEVRDSILVKAVRESIAGYEVRQAVDRAVSHKATLVAQELCDTPEWSARITEAVQGGFSEALKNASERIASAFRR